MNVGSSAFVQARPANIAKAPRQAKKGGKKLPVDVWEAKRKEANQRRRLRSNEKKRLKNEELRREKEVVLGHLPPEELQRLEDERRQRAVSQHLEREQRVTEALANGLKIVVDCSFNETANVKESRSLSKQLEVCVAANKRASVPVSLTFTGFKGPFQEQCHKMGAHGWRANKHPQPTLELFDASKVVVLSPDAPAPLLALDPTRVYVIGGLIDRSVQKNATLKYAESSGLSSVRLPFEEFSEQLGLAKGAARSPVLNVNDVVCALMEFNAHGDWVSALDKALPARKRRDPQQPSRRRGIRPSSPQRAQQAAAKRTCTQQQVAGGPPLGHPAAGSDGEEMLQHVPGQATGGGVVGAAAADGDGEATTRDGFDATNDADDVVVAGNGCRETGVASGDGGAVGGGCTAGGSKTAPHGQKAGVEDRELVGQGDATVMGSSGVETPLNGEHATGAARQGIGSQQRESTDGDNPLGEHYSTSSVSGCTDSDDSVQGALAGRTAL